MRRARRFLHPDESHVRGVIVLHLAAVLEAQFSTREWFSRVA
ncbi:hypothetical protein [Corallococcus aberystwythensis]|nr:hypothetical protein [Corallococcus aberystwythensis]